MSFMTDEFKRTVRTLLKKSNKTKIWAFQDWTM